MKHTSVLSFILPVTLALVLVASSHLPAYAQGAQIVVNTLKDNLEDDKNCSLREAITNANDNSQTYGDCTGGQLGWDTITFSVSGEIRLTSALPEINDELEIKAHGQNVSISGDEQFRIFFVSSLHTLSLAHLTIRDGYSPNYGGGVYNWGTIKINDCIFIDNVAEYGGGAFNSYGPFSIKDSVFTNNKAGSSGGAISIYGATSEIETTTFLSNHANFNGGGIYISNGTIRITSSTFSNNTAVNGGGVYNFDSVMIANSTFSNNQVIGSGGGVFNLDALTVKSSTFSENNAGSFGGGIWNFGALRLMNTIVANSPSGFDCYNGVSSTITVNIHNLIESSATGHSCGTPMLTADPMLYPLTDNGGPTQTHALQPGSPAIDAGHNGRCASNYVWNKDQIGKSRPIDGDGDQIAICDIGSFEVR